jgi:hypothetical protein
MTFPPDHWSKIHSTNGLERLNGEVKRRTEVVGIFPNDEAIIRLVGAILLEQNDESAVQRARYMTLETMATLAMMRSSDCQPWSSDQPGPSRNVPWPSSNYTTPWDTIRNAVERTDGGAGHDRLLSGFRFAARVIETSENKSVEARIAMLEPGDARVHGLDRRQEAPAHFVCDLTRAHIGQFLVAHSSSSRGRAIAARTSLPLRNSNSMRAGS